MKRLRKVIAMAIASATFAFATPALAMPDIMPLSEVAEGMTGTLYTVVDSSGEVKSFDAEILGVMQSGSGTMPYIIARSDGPFADTTGGLMQGMSGSPVYVDGRLIGAASATLSDMDPHTFLITPIESMLPIWDMPDKKNQTRPAVIDFKKEEKAKTSKPDEKSAETNDAAEGKNDKDENVVGVEITTAETEADKAAETEKKDDEGAKKDEPSNGNSDEKNDKSDKDDKAENNKDEKNDVKSDEPKKDESKAKEGDASDKADEAKDKASDDEKEHTPSVGKEPEYKATFYAAGFGERGMRELKARLNPLGYQALPFGGTEGDSSHTDYDATLYPGDAVGAALVYGDFSFAATGTVTAVDDDNRILAFGHPFLHRGNVNYFMTDATILGMVNGMTDGLKFANTGSVIGRINQDREAGISGQIGVFPTVVPLRLSVEDTTLGRSSDFAAMMAYDEDFVPLLSPIISYAALGRVTDTTAGSTVKVHFNIRTNATQKGNVERTNLYYSPSDTGQFAFGELNTAMNLIVADTEREADIYDIKVDISSEAERKTASLISAIPDKPEAKPGETVNFTVTMKPYRAEKVKVTVPFIVPKAQREGAMNLDIHGGGLISIEKLLAAADAAAGVDTSATEDKTQTTESKLLDFEKEPSNNDIVIEPGAGPLMSEKEQHQAIKNAVKAQKRADAEEKEKPHQALPSFTKKEEPRTGWAKVSTDYVIDNVIHATLHIKDKD